MKIWKVFGDESEDTGRHVIHFQMGQDRLDGLGDPKQVKYVPCIYLLACLLCPGNTRVRYKV